MKDRAKMAWAFLREQKIGDVADRLKEYLDNVKHGADPIEAMHGHLCGPKCMHWDTMDEEHKAKLRKAPWNRKKA